MSTVLAYTILCREGCTCVLTNGHQTFTSMQRGVRPLLALLDSGQDLRGYSAADKVVGRAAAMIYCLMGIEALHAAVISQSALAVLRRQGIAVTWDTLVSGIRNRTDTGPCPMEQATAGVDDPRQALAAIRQKLNELRGCKKSPYEKNCGFRMEVAVFLW